MWIEFLEEENTRTIGTLHEKKKKTRRAQQVFLIQKGQDYPIFKSLFHAQHSKPFPQIFRLSKMKSLEQIKSRVVKLVVVCPFILKLYSVDRTIIYPGIKVYLSTHLDASPYPPSDATPHRR